MISAMLRVFYLTLQSAAVRRSADLGCSHRRRSPERTLSARNKQTSGYADS